MDRQMQQKDRPVSGRRVPPIAESGSSLEAGVASLQRSAGNRAVAALLGEGLVPKDASTGTGPGTVAARPAPQSAEPTVARQPAPSGSGRRAGEAWAYGPITQRKSATHDLAKYVGWIRDVERGYGPDKQMVLQRLRRLHYSSYSGKAGTKFDRVIEENVMAGNEPLTILQAPAAAVDGLYETDEVVTPDGRKLDPGHILAALDVKTAGATTKAVAAEKLYDTNMVAVLTWAGDLASWWLEWTQQARKIHETPPPPETGPATDEGPASERGGDPALDAGLWEQIGRSKVSKEDLLGDLDAQVLAATSTQRSTAESVKREKRPIRGNIGVELTAPVSKLLEDYYGVGTSATAAPSANRFAKFLEHARPQIPYQEGEDGGTRWMRLGPDAEEVVRKAIENVAFMFVAQGTSQDAHETMRKYGWRLKDVAKRFVGFLNEGLRSGDAAWL